MQIHYGTLELNTVSTDAVVLLVTAAHLDGPKTDFEKQVYGAARAQKFSAKPGEVAAFPTFGLIPAPHVFLIGTGNDDHLRRAAGAAGYKARELSLKSLAIFGAPEGDNAAEIIATGLAAGNYRFDKYRASKDRKAKLETVHIAGTDNSGAQRGLKLAEARNLTRDLVNAPPAEVYPESLAAVCEALASDTLTVTIWDADKIKSEGMGGITAVGQGSSNPARFVHMHYKPKGNARKSIALVGKGVTFDAGGLSIKSSGGMQTMRCDMAGAGAVVGAMKAVSLLQPDVEVHGIIGCVENMCGANSYKLGDILDMYNGKQVEIHNTDAEGRLVMADCLTYGDKLGADAIVDLATLTGACVVALGDYYSGLFTNAEQVAGGLSSAAAVSGEGLWRMPLPDFYKPMLKAEWGHFKNVGGRAAGSITAALFLSEFVEQTPWAHIDIAGPAFLDKTFRHLTCGGTGAMVETLYRWIESK